MWECWTSADGVYANVNFRAILWIVSEELRRCTEYGFIQWIYLFNVKQKIIRRYQIWSLFRQRVIRRSRWSRYWCNSLVNLTTSIIACIFSNRWTWNKPFNNRHKYLKKTQSLFWCRNFNAICVCHMKYCHNSLICAHTCRLHSISYLF